MKGSYNFFQNIDCEYYPCHNDMEDINCLFCFCPLYFREKCPGDFKNIIFDEKIIKDCSQCVFPHKAENYEVIIKLLR